MKFVFLFVQLLLFQLCFGQKANEVMMTINHSLNKEDRLVGTPLNFEDFGSYSSLNLKNTINSGITFQFQRSLKTSRFFIVGSFNENIIRYKTTLYHPKYELAGEFKKSKELIFYNSSVALGIGLFRRFGFFSSKLEWDIGFQFKHRHFRDSEVSKSKNESPDFDGHQSGDLKYEVKLDYFSGNQRLVLNPYANLSYKITKNLSCSLTFSYSTPMNIYFEPRVSGYTENDIGPVIGGWVGQYFGKFNVQTTSISAGLGIKYRIVK